MRNFKFVTRFKVFNHRISFSSDYVGQKGGAKTDESTSEHFSSLSTDIYTLFVFSLSDRKQNARSLLTPVSGPDFYALSCGTFGFALHDSFFYHFLIG